MAMKLNECPLRTPAKVLDVHVDPSFMLRLRELGVRQGADFTVVNRAAFGGVVVNIGGTRVAIDHRCAKEMEVEPVA